MDLLRLQIKNYGGLQITEVVKEERRVKYRGNINDTILKYVE